MEKFTTIFGSFELKKAVVSLLKNGFSLQMQFFGWFRWWTGLIRQLMAEMSMSCGLLIRSPLEFELNYHLIKGEWLLPFVS